METRTQTSPSGETQTVMVDVWQCGSCNYTTNICEDKIEHLAKCRINNRGWPRHGADVHFYMLVDTRADNGLGPLYDTICRNGAYHLRYTENRNLVTCQVCRDKIKPGCD